MNTRYLVVFYVELLLLVCKMLHVWQLRDLLIPTKKIIFVYLEFFGESTKCIFLFTVVELPHPFDASVRFCFDYLPLPFISCFVFAYFHHGIISCMTFIMPQFTWNYLYWCCCWFPLFCLLSTDIEIHCVAVSLQELNRNSVHCWVPCNFYGLANAYKCSRCSVLLLFISFQSSKLINNALSAMHA